MYGQHKIFFIILANKSAPQLQNTAKFMDFKKVKIYCFVIKKVPLKGKIPMSFQPFYEIMQSKMG